MRIVMVGVNHRTAPLDLREQLAVPSAETAAALTSLRQGHDGLEAVLVSTCNRTELYIARPAHAAPDAEALRHWLAERSGQSVDAVTAATIHREQGEALSHLYRVCAGLESMVLGETEILGQVRRSYEAAIAADAVGPVLHRVFQGALATAKQVRRETGIDRGRLSMGAVAADFARNVFESFADKTILGIGAGEIAKTTLKHLMDLHPHRLWITNRTGSRATELADALGLTSVGGGARAWDDLEPLLVEADVVVTSTAAPEPIITASAFRRLHRRRRNRPLFIIDLAVPRDVDPAVASFSNVYLYDVDDLQDVIRANAGSRQEQVAACERMLADAVAACLAEIQNRDLGQLIRQLRERLRDIGDAEKQRTLRKLANLNGGADAQTTEKLLDEHTHRVVNKILHLPLSQLDQRKTDAPLGFYAAALRRLFDLHDDHEH